MLIYLSHFRGSLQVAPNPFLEKYLYENKNKIIMKRGLILIIIILGLIVISGCTQIPNLPKPGNLLGLSQKEKVITESKGQRKRQYMEIKDKHEILFLVL